jgi:hypothetical protein
MKNVCSREGRHHREHEKDHASSRKRLTALEKALPDDLQGRLGTLEQWTFHHDGRGRLTAVHEALEASQRQVDQLEREVATQRSLIENLRMLAPLYGAMRPSEPAPQHHVLPYGYGAAMPQAGYSAPAMPHAGYEAPAMPQAGYPAPAMAYPGYPQTAQASLPLQGLQALRPRGVLEHQLGQAPAAPQPPSQPRSTSPKTPPHPGV